MAKELLTIGDGGKAVFFKGTAAEFKAEIVAGVSCGFTSPDNECTWEDEASHVLDYAESQERGFGEVVWLESTALGGPSILLVVG